MDTTELSNLIGWQILQELLSLAHKNGKFTIDPNTFLPKENKIWINNHRVRRLHAMMTTCGIIPCQEVEQKGYDFLQNFVSASFSDNRKEKVLNIILNFIGDKPEYKIELSENLSNWKDLLEMFKYFFFNRKKIDNLLNDGEPDYSSEKNLSMPLFYSRFTRDMIILKKISSICNEMEEILVLLMGDYADKNFDMIELKYDCPF